MSSFLIFDNIMIQLFFQDLPELKAPISWYKEQKKENRIALQSWLSQAINATRPSGSRYSEGEYEVFKKQVSVDKLPFTKTTLSADNYKHQLNTILLSTGNKIRYKCNFPFISFTFIWQLGLKILSLGIQSDHRLPRDPNLRRLSDFLVSNGVHVWGIFSTPSHHTLLQLALFYQNDVWVLSGHLWCQRCHTIINQPWQEE